MSDGAHIGVSAERALETILGGKESPGPEEQQTREQVLARVMGAPLPGEPKPSGYGQAADSIAHAFIKVLEDDPGLPLNDDALWAAVKKRWPDFSEWQGGPSGFQVGWALNCVRWLKQEPPTPNPAIL